MKLTFLQNIFKLFRRKGKLTKDKQKISDVVLDSERIVRSIFSPLYLHKRKKTLQPIAFKSPRNIDEVSVNRLEFTTPDFCKTISKEIEQPENRKSYFGLAVIKTSEIRDVRAEVVYSPIVNVNDFHSDIKIGYVLATGEELPAEFQLKIKRMTNLARLYPDMNPDDSKWAGDKNLI